MTEKDILLFSVLTGMFTMIGQVILNWINRPRMLADAKKVEAEAEKIDVENITSLTAKLMDAMSMVIRQQVQMQELQDALSRLETEASVRDGKFQAESTKRDKEKIELEERIKLLENEKADRDKRISQLEKLLADETGKREALEAELATDRSANEAKISQLTEKIVALRNELDIVKAERDALRKQIEELQHSQSEMAADEQKTDPDKETIEHEDLHNAT